MAMVHVSGIEAGQVILFALSTCVWCKKTKQLIDDLHVAYDYEYVDLLQGSDRDLAVETVRKWNNTCSFPTLIIHNKCIVGYDEKEIREALKQ